MTQNIELRWLKTRCQVNKQATTPSGEPIIGGGTVTKTEVTRVLQYRFWIDTINSWSDWHNVPEEEIEELVNN